MGIKMGMQSYWGSTQVTIHSRTIEHGRRLTLLLIIVVKMKKGDIVKLFYSN